MPVKTSLNKNQILRRLREQEANIKEFGVAKLGLFGSVVRGEETDESDIDILVEFNEGQKTYDNFIHLAFYLEDLLYKEVQLVTEKSLSKRLKKYIEKEIEYVSFSS